jgi:hypothetical protein
MNNTPQALAVANYRSRLTGRGMARFEVIGLESDRELIRALARRLAESTPEARKIRTAIYRRIASPRAQKGGIVDALRRSPLVGASLHFGRPGKDAREVES